MELGLDEMSVRSLQLEAADDVSVKNGNFFGLSTTPEEASVVFLPVPWDVTTSYGEGAAQGPKAILEASYQLDLYDFDLPQAWKIGHGTLPISSDILTQNNQMRQIAKSVIDHLEAGKNRFDADIQQKLQAINQSSEKLNDWVYHQSKQWLENGKLVGLIGGDHSAPLGLMRALGERHEAYGICHIDAHLDLRPGFEGFTYSHASIMHHALKLPNISHLVQIGVRDVCQVEMTQVENDSRIVLFDDWQLKENVYQGMSWTAQCEKIVETLPEKVYVSFDIDGLSPEFCPGTGTPVPGGLDFNQAIYLVKTIVSSGRTIIGFDLCEVSPGPSGEWDGNVGARILYKLANLMYRSHHRR